MSLLVIGHALPHSSNIWASVQRGLLSAALAPLLLSQEIRPFDCVFDWFCLAPIKPNRSTSGNVQLLQTSLTNFTSPVCRTKLSCMSARKASPEGLNAEVPAMRMSPWFCGLSDRLRFILVIRFA